MIMLIALRLIHLPAKQEIIYQPSPPDPHRSTDNGFPLRVYRTSDRFKSLAIKHLDVVVSYLHTAPVVQRRLLLFRYDRCRCTDHVFSCGLT